MKSRIEYAHVDTDSAKGLWRLETQIEQQNNDNKFQSGARLGQPSGNR